MVRRRRAPEDSTRRYRELFRIGENRGLRYADLSPGTLAGGGVRQCAQNCIQ